MKYCKDCKFYKSFSKWGAECHHPSRLVDDVVNGPVMRLKTPRSARENKDDCGPDATLFEKSWSILDLFKRKD